MPSTTPPAGGGVLNLYGIDPYTLDPAVSGEMSSQQYIVQIFSGLVRLDDNLEPAPDIAERWEISNDGRTYTFYLRHDVKFQDGRPMKAEDVKFSWQRAADPATGSLTAATYLGDIVGVKEVLAGNTKEISGVKVIDEYTLQVTIDAPKSYFLSKLTYPTAFVVDKDNVGAGGEWWRSPNGTGPFKLKEWTEGSQLVLERNNLYYGKVASVDSVVFHLLAGFPMDLYETGQIDVAGVSLDYIDRVTDKLAHSTVNWLSCLSSVLATSASIPPSHPLMMSISVALSLWPLIRTSWCLWSSGIWCRGPMAFCRRAYLASIRTWSD